MSSDYFDSFTFQLRAMFIFDRQSSTKPVEATSKVLCFSFVVSGLKIKRLLQQNDLLHLDLHCIAMTIWPPSSVQRHGIRPSASDFAGDGQTVMVNR